MAYTMPMALAYTMAMALAMVGCLNAGGQGHGRGPEMRPRGLIMRLGVFPYKDWS